MPVCVLLMLEYFYFIFLLHLKQGNGFILKIIYSMLKVTSLEFYLVKWRCTSLLPNKNKSQLRRHNINHAYKFRFFSLDIYIIWYKGVAQ